MESNLNTGRAFDWNDEIQNDSDEFIVLPEGDYDFEVKSFERGRHNGSEKVPACNKAILKIEVKSGDKKTTITHNLLLHSNVEGMVCAFFTAIGQRKHGEKLRMDWNKVVGSRGRCKVIVDTYTNKNTGEEMKNNKIRRFYAPDEKSSAPQAAAQAAPTPQQTSFAAGRFGGGFGSFGGNR